MSTQPNWTTLLQEAVSKPGLILEAYTAFYGYSIGNQLLALIQCHQRDITPGPIATYPGWLEKGRQVKKGEKAITLCQPISFKDKADPEQRRLGFMFKPRWFVLSQTEGEDMPPIQIPAWSKIEALFTLDIEQVAFELSDGNVQGYARWRSIAINPLAQLPHKTLFHELAHVTLGHTAESEFTDADATPPCLREVEAEAVALICCETLGMTGADYARGYIQNWLRGDGAIPEQSAQKIFRAADVILRAGRPEEKGEGN
ncbi:MAG: DUF1738 domain-containing protein [Rubrivivax sp.]|nr:DUF1738 domain-containing protein [Pyrinomonadaceae bacterium]